MENKNLVTVVVVLVVLVVLGLLAWWYLQQRAQTPAVPPSPTEFPPAVPPSPTEFPPAGPSPEALPPVFPEATVPPVLPTPTPQQ